MSTGPRGERTIAFADFHRLPGDTPQRDTNLDAGRARHRDRAAAAGLRDELHLPQDPRPALLCVRAGVRRGRRWSSTAARSRRRASRSAASRTSPGATPQAEAALRGQPAERGDVRAGGRSRAARRQGLRAQHLQDRSGAPRHRPRADAGGARHAAVAVQQEDRVSERHGTLHRHRHIPRRRRRQGHRRRQVCRRVQRARPRPCERRLLDDRQGPHHAHRHQRGHARRRRARPCSRTRTVRPWRTTIRPTRTRWRRTARRTGRCTTARSCSTASRSRWSSPRRRRSRASRRRWFGWNTRRSRMSRTCIASAMRPSPVKAPTNPMEALFAPPKPRGTPDQALAAAAVRHEAEYYVPIEHHNPMELYASTVIFEAGGKLTVYDKTQGVQNVQQLSLRRVRHEAGGCARHVAVHGRRLRLGPAPAVSGGAGGAGGARAAALGARRADAASRCMCWATGRR